MLQPVIEPFVYAIGEFIKILKDRGLKIVYTRDNAEKIYFLKRKVSSTVRRVNTFSISIPGSFGCVGFAPGERINLS